MVSRRRCRFRRRSEGYNLVALLVLITVVNIAVAAALPTWSQAVKRDKEAELIFRGLQYAEAIRVFQLRHGRYPTSLRELITISPRSIRQLWTDPFNDDGEWALILAQAPAAGGRPVAGGGGGPGAGDDRSRRRRRPGETTPEKVVPRERVTDPDGLDIPRAGQVVARGPVLGVRSLSDDEGVRTFNGSSKYSEWLFTVELIPILPQGAVGENVPRLHTHWLGKPFPEGVGLPQPGGLPAESERKNPLDSDRSRRRLRRPDRGEG